MEREYEQDENYIKLTEELNILKNKRKQLMEICKNLISRDKLIADEINSMDDEIEFLKSENDKLLEEQTDKTRKKIAIISTVAATSVALPSFGMAMAIKDIEMNQVIKLALALVCVFGALPVPITLELWLQSKLEKKYVTKKEQEIKKTTEYTEVLSRIEKLQQEIEKKELLADKLSIRINSISERIDDFSFDISMRKIELQNKYLKEHEIIEFKKDCLEDTIQSKPKARRLVKENN